MNKHEIKTQLIIDTAFRVWGDNFFHNTSLSTLSDALGMTKQALYRYFKNKQAILDAMKYEFIASYRILLKKSHGKNLNNLDDLLVDYTETPVRFFAENYHYYRFFVLKLIHTETDITSLISEITEGKDNFLSQTILINMGYSKIDAAAVSGFIHSVGGFLLNQRLFDSNPITNREIDQIVKIIRVVVRNGFSGARKKANLIDYNKVEKKSSIDRKDILPYNKIFTAVAEVIAEKGVWETTVDAIAEQLDMGKSSLYFYFDNKEQMINDVVDRERDHLNELIIKRVTQFDTFEEQLYSIFYVMSTYFILKPSIFAIMNWLRYQFINKPVAPVNKKLEKFSEYINLISQNSTFNPLGFPPELIAEGLSFILIHGLWECLGTGCSKEIMILRMRKVHHLFLYGLKGIGK